MEGLLNFIIYFDATHYFNVAFHLSKKLDFQCHHFQAAHAKRKEVFQRAEKYVKQYREKERDEIRLKREAKKNNGYVQTLCNETNFNVKIAASLEVILSFLRCPQHIFSTTRQRSFHAMRKKRVRFLEN